MLLFQFIVTPAVTTGNKNKLIEKQFSKFAIMTWQLLKVSFQLNFILKK